MRKRIARALITTDKHVIDKDFKTVQGYRKALRQNIEDQIEYCEQNEVTHVFDTGDIGDRGFKVLSQAYSWEVLFRRWRETVDYYVTIGNHLFLEMDSNPELYWIQPSPFVQPKDADYVPPEEPLLKTVDSLVIGTVMFSFHHFNKTDKDYIRYRPPGITHHHAIYHDDIILPSNIQRDFYQTTNVDTNYLNSIYENVDSATVGHIHKPYGLVKMHINGREVPVDVPGSCGITNRGEAEVHSYVDLPQYDVYDDGTIEKTYVRFSTHLEMMTFFKPKDRSVPKEILEYANEIQSSFQGVDKAREVLIKSTSKKLSVEAYLTQLGYTQNGIDLFTRSTFTKLSTVDVLNILYNKDHDHLDEFDLV